MAKVEITSGDHRVAGVNEDGALSVAVSQGRTEALQITPLPEGRTAFGETLVGELTPEVELAFPYNLNSLQVAMRDNQSGSSAVSNSLAQMSSGAAANSSSQMVSINKVRYSPGLGIRGRFTAMYTEGVDGSTQIAGVGSAAEGFFFGYNGADFGVLHRYGGSPEIRTLTVTTASTTAENITVTLNGDADATVAVTNTGDTTLTANEIAAHDYSSLGPGWDAVAVGSTVVFTSWEASPQTGTYSIAGTTAAGTFAQTLAGVTPTEDWTLQSGWNGEDRYDGEGPLNVRLNPQKLNVFQITFQYLGAGLISFYIENPSDGTFHLVHSIEWANANTGPTLQLPTLPVYFGAINTSNTSDLTVSTASAALFIEGIATNSGLKRGIKAALALGATAAETPITSFRMKEVFQGQRNGGTLKLNYVSAAVEHTKPCAINFYANATLTGASFSDIDGSTSSVQQDVAATAATGGTLLFTLYLGKTGNAVLDLKDDLTVSTFAPGNTVTITLAPTSGNAAEGNVGINFTEKL